MDNPMNATDKKMDGFRDEQYFIIPTQSISEHADHPLISPLFLTDVGYFPHALHHFRQRDEGIDENILIYCVGGKGTVITNGQKFHIGQDQAIGIPCFSGHVYYANSEEPWSIFWVHFKGENAQFFPIDPCRVINISGQHAQNRLMFLFDLLFRVLEGNYTLGNTIYTSQVLALILSEVYHREKIDTTGKQNRHLTLIIRFMYKRIHENITLETLCSEFGLSKSYINAIFKTFVHRSPIDFFINLKMHEACKLLKSNNMYVNEVSRILGYDDPYYFSRIFKQHVGLSPTKYKNSEYIHYK